MKEVVFSIKEAARTSTRPPSSIVATAADDQPKSVLTALPSKAQLQATAQNARNKEKRQPPCPPNAADLEIC